MSGAALLIGNSDGIGLALTTRLIERGFAVTGVSKSPSPVSHEAYRHIVLDVSSADSGPDSTLPCLRAAFVYVSIAPALATTSPWTDCNVMWRRSRSTWLGSPRLWKGSSPGWWLMVQPFSLVFPVWLM